MRTIFEGLVFFGAMATICMALVFLAALSDPMWSSFVR